MPKMPQNICCCGITTRTAVIAIGFYALIRESAYVAFMYLGSNVYQRPSVKEIFQSYKRYVWPVEEILAYCHLFATITLLIGAQKHVRNFLLPYLIIEAIFLGYKLKFFCISFYYICLIPDPPIGEFCALTAFCILEAYLYIVVLTHYIKDMKAEFTVIQVSCDKCDLERKSRRISLDDEL